MAAPSLAPTYALSILAILITGCPIPEEPDLCTPFSNDEAGGEACDETGGADVEVGALAADECIYKENLSRDGYRVQCEGEFHSKIDFRVLGQDCVEAINDEFCSQVYPFGPPHDTYEAPAVMACCGEALDPAEHLDVYQDFCMYDLVAQACASIAKRLEKAVEAGDFGAVTDKAMNLQEYVESHFEECALALYDGDSNPAPGELVAQWKLPNKLGPDGWWPAKDIVVAVEAGTSVVDVHRPDDAADWLECHGARDNDDEIFEDQSSPNGSVFVGVKLAENIGGQLIGPVIGSGVVTSTPTFAASCVDQGCPNASWSYANGPNRDFTLEEFELYTTNFDMTNGTSSLTVERARVQLWTQARGAKIFAEDGSVLGYRVLAGQAWFYVAGMANGIYSRHMAVNSTDIEITEDRGRWTVRSFDIESTDGADRTWTLTLGGSRWQR